MYVLLVPFDGSDCALRALRHAVAVVRATGGGAVHVVYAHEEPRVYGEIEVYVSRERMAELQKRESESLLEGADSVLREAAVTSTKEILIGPIGATIAKRANEMSCDGIVMGTHGRGALGSLLLGSVAIKVIHHAEVPVTLVK